VSLTARAEVLADLSEVAMECAGCFCRARCAGLDIKAIASVAKAAATLGADMRQLRADAPPYHSDAGYLAGLEEVRAALRDRIRDCGRLTREADRQAEMAARAMRAALMTRPPDYTAYQMALATYQDAKCAAEVAGDTISTCDAAFRLLLSAGADFAWAYEEPEAFAAAGHVLPADGRWITGQPA
jgi:hypothetical protein